jgi:hypothetical protein
MPVIHDELGKGVTEFPEVSGKRVIPIIDQVANSLAPAEYDYISLSYSGGNLTGIVFKTGGSTGETVSTLTLAYDSGDNLISVTKS